jgi:hypothetical protein
MVAFEAVCEGYISISANLRTKQGRGDDYILVTLTSSNSGWHKGWFYLRNDPEFTLPSYTRTPSQSRRGTGQTAPPRRSSKRSSSITGPCWGAFEEPESPWRR